MHYGLSSGSFGGILHEILLDMCMFKHIHNWDEKLFEGPLKSILKVVHRSWGENRCTLASVIAHSTGQEIGDISSNDGNNPSPPTEDARNVDSYFVKCSSYFKKASGKGASPFPTPQKIKSRDDNIGGISSSIEGTNSLSLAQGRIMHLSLDCGLKLPYHRQEKSPPEIDSSRQKCYKRVTISCHITYLTLSNADEWENTEDQLDRARIFPFHHRKAPASSGDIFLVKASSSVLLTLCTPEESESCEEEVHLLRTPRALWTVLAINTSAEYASDHQMKQYLTPIAQYRTNAEIISGDMRKWLKDFQSESIFDDEQFTKSTSYHWAVRTCDELSESIASTLRFMRVRVISSVDKLCREAHAYEKLGIEHWLERMKEETFALKDLHAQILALRVQVQESLHGVISILEAGTALQQGERMKTLAYLATIYLPLAATSSLYSMSVFPKSATFLSFFLVFAFLFFCIMLLGMNLKTIPQRSKTRTVIPNAAPVLAYMQSDEFYRLPDVNFWVFRLGRWFISGLPIVILRNLVLPEICMPIDQYIMYQYRYNPYENVDYHPVWFIKDVIRALLIPAWIAVVVGIVGYLVVLDILYGSLLLVHGLLCWC
ncbi:hypothetical protein F5882DRAFT_507259 [Hyaloscypha sp. PMI_1271]|nr:hypothetical protein F5882DRAFT_507259 [Hyaloscypha sp. PMI_1271]